MAKTQASPVIRRQLKAWLKAGIMEDHHLFPTTAGTPQGGVDFPFVGPDCPAWDGGGDHPSVPASPCHRCMRMTVVVLHEDRQVLEHCQQLLMTWLAEIGLTLNEAKSRISHTLEGDQPGFDFLGFHIRQYRVGKHQSGKRPDGQRLGYQDPDQTCQGQHRRHIWPSLDGSLDAVKPYLRVP